MHRHDLGTSARTRLVVGLAAVLIATLTGVVVQPTRATALPAGCDWPVYIGKDGLNVLAPDYQANYWILHYTVVPGTSLRLDGTYPEARFFSHTLQDETTITTAALVDRDINPDRRGTNPYRTAGAQPGAPYSIRINFGTEPASGAETNTLYAGETLEGEPNPGGTLIYRIYVSTEQGDKQAGQPLPTVVWETPGGDVDLTLDQCQPAGDGLRGPLNEATYDADRPLPLPALTPTGSDYRPQPDFVRIHDGGFADPVLNALPPDINALIPRREGVPVANKPFPYLRSSISRKFGETMAVRFKVPTFPDTVNGESVTQRSQVRYWSLCSYAALEEGGLRGNDCRTDFEVKPDRRGYVTFVVSDPSHRPAPRILRSTGVEWLPWGPWEKDFLLLRIGLPRENWRHSPLRVSPDASDQIKAARAAMGPYYPVARYCDHQKINKQGLASCF